MNAVPFHLLSYIAYFLAFFSAIFFLFNALQSFKVRNEDANRRVDKKKVSALIPVYKEEPEVFERCVRSIANEGIDFVVFGDGNVEPYRTITKKYGGRFYYSKVRKGKRGAIGRGIAYISTEFVLLIDSDTEIKKGSIEKMLRKFDESTGGVGCTIKVRKSKKIVYYCSEFFMRLQEIPARVTQKYGSQLVINGQCGMYRTELIKPFLQSKEFENLRFMGISTNLCEDRQRTSYIMQMGYKAKIAYDAEAITEPQKSMVGFFKQALRWTRGGYFYLFKEIFDGSYFKKGLIYEVEIIYLFFFPLLLFLLNAASFYNIVHLNIFSYFKHRMFFYLFATTHLFLPPRLILSFWIRALDLIGLFGIAMFLASRIKSERKKVLLSGLLVLGILFVVSIYGFFTFFKQKDWLTR
ncbi:MAG: glycosyltransferase [Candidatus Micrarchaeaceae archaeon]